MKAAKAADMKELTAAAVKPVVKPGDEVKKPDVDGKKGLAIGASCVKSAEGTRPACLEGSCCGLLKKGFMGGSKE